MTSGSISDFSENEKRLITGLAKVMHEWLQEYTTYYPESNGYKWHSFLFEQDFELLWRLGLAKAAWPQISVEDLSFQEFIDDEPRFEGIGCRGACFLEIHKDDIEENICFDYLLPKYSVSAILLSFQSLATHWEIAPYYSGQMFDKYSDKFKIFAPDFQPAVDVLLEFGYLNTDGEAYWWTDNMPKATLY